MDNSISKKKNPFASTWHYVKLFFSVIYRKIDRALELSVGNLIHIILKKRGHTRESLWKSASKITWFIIIITLVFLNNILFGNPLLNYTVYYPYSWIIRLLSNIPGIYGKIFGEFGLLFWNGILATFHLSITGTVIGLLIALLFSAIANLKITSRDDFVTKIFKFIGKGFVKIYVTVIRSTPMMVQAMLLYFGLITIFRIDYMTAGLITVSLNTAAYLTEVLRGAISGLDKGQNEAARSLGLTNWQTMLSVIYPQAIKNAMPSIGNELVINIKDTSVLSVIMVVDIFRVAEIAQGRHGQAFPPYLIAAGIYLIFTITVTFILRKIEKKLELPQVALPSSN